MRALPGRLVLLGHPVAHSLSPAFQNAALRSARIPLSYEALDVTPAHLAPLFHELIGARAAGNVTVPHKEAVTRLVSDVSPLARRVGAVNTFWVEDGRAIGDNTDVHGFSALARSVLGAPPMPGPVAVLGAGGAASAVLAALELWPTVELRVFNRHAERARSMLDRLGVDGRICDSPHDAIVGAAVIVNATPVGLSGDTLPFPLEWLDARAVVLDLVYRRGETALVRGARARGHVAADGLCMLLEQGAAAFERWFGFAPDGRAMEEAVGR